MNLDNAKNQLFFFLFLIVLLPMLQYNFGFIESGKLQGETERHPDIQFSWEKWWDGTYQQQKSLFLNDSVGFRPDLVRMNNQIDYTLFRKLHSSGEYVGTDDYLFQKVYVDEYEGVSYLGTNVIRDELIKLKLVQDTLNRLGKTLILVYAPSKPYYFPEKIPEILRPYNDQKRSNYKTFRRIGDSLKIKQLDFNALFMSMKDTARSPLFTKGGTHWSIYGSLLAADSLIKFIERERKIKMPEIEITAMHYSDTARNADDDLAKITNLIYPICKERLTYPDYRYNDNSTLVKPKTIYIGDSFVWLWVYNGLLQNTSSNWEYWYYFDEIWDSKGERSIKDWQKSMLDADCIIAVFTPMNLRIFDSKTFFIEKFYDYFYPGK